MESEQKWYEVALVEILHESGRCYPFKMCSRQVKADSVEEAARTFVEHIDTFLLTYFSREVGKSCPWFPWDLAFEIAFFTPEVTKLLVKDFKKHIYKIKISYSEDGALRHTSYLVMNKDSLKADENGLCMQIIDR